MNRWRDNGLHYGRVTRLLHWAMAALFAWQFLGMGLRLALGRTPLVSFFVGTHASIGLLLMFLAALRALWGIFNLRNRPAHGTGWIGAAARLGHLALYALILCVPLLAILRAYGSQRGATFFGIPIIPGAPQKLEWMVSLGNAAHGLLAWALLALVAGHIAMVFIHRHVWKDDVWARMAGRQLQAAE
ncbi:cytochrome b [Rhizobium helianthi]|uniref:Cytochrome b n=1 Tax=Rhizobium helianthi TaxID=1132695 RepID=A0ABW4M9Q5_9HYPH